MQVDTPRTFLPCVGLLRLIEPFYAKTGNVEKVFPIEGVKMAMGVAYVSNRGAGTVTVVDPDGKLVANLDDGTFPNHVATDAQGNVFAVNKSKGPDDQDGDRITRITQVR